MDMNKETDPMGRAIAEYHRTGKADALRVFSPMFDEDTIPLEVLFRSYREMPPIEQRALDLSAGRILDVGAGAGCHSLVLQERGADVTALDISPLAVETMRQRGLGKVLEQDFFALQGQFDTILLLMNGLGIVGTLEHMPRLFRHLDTLLAPGGQLLGDSSDLCYLFLDEDGIIQYPNSNYYGELSFQMQYRDTIGAPFPWLYLDAQTLTEQALAFGYHVEIVMEGAHYDYLARITKML